MKGWSLFAEPGGIRIDVTSGLPRAEAIARLEAAVKERAYSTPDRESPGFLRLGGVVTGDTVAVRARPYVMPGLIAGYGAMEVELRGRVVAHDEGSALRGVLTAPIGWKTPLLLSVVLLAWAGLGILTSRGSAVGWGFTLVGGTFVAAMWVVVMRRNQRMALRHARELERVLGSILGERSGTPGARRSEGAARTPARSRECS
jgi:hypothetical protein